LYNKRRVPTRLATEELSNTIETSRIAVAVDRLNNTRINMNFQKATTLGTSLMSPYTIPPNNSGGTTRSGRMSNSSLDEKYVNDE